VKVFACPIAVESESRNHQEGDSARQIPETVGQGYNNKPQEALALTQLAQIDLLLGNINSAEQHALRGLAIDEELQIVRELPADYQILFRIAQACGNAAAAAEWAKKRDDLLAELRRRAGGGGGLGGPENSPQKLLDSRRNLVVNFPPAVETP
jgi:hypothetical protein